MPRPSGLDYNTRRDAMPPYNEVHWPDNAPTAKWFETAGLNTPYNIHADLLRLPSTWAPWNGEYDLVQLQDTRVKWFGRSATTGKGLELWFTTGRCNLFLYYPDKAPPESNANDGWIFFGTDPADFVQAAPTPSLELHFADNDPPPESEDPTLCKIAVSMYRYHFVPMADTVSTQAKNQQGLTWRRIRCKTDDTNVYVQQDDSQVSLPSE